MVPKKQSKAVTMCALCPDLLVCEAEGVEAEGEADAALSHVRAVFIDDDVHEIIDTEVGALSRLLRVIFRRGAA